MTSTLPGTTTHLVTSDKWGNVVSYTFTIESAGGAGIVVPGYGFLLNNELTDFNFDSTTHREQSRQRQAAAQLDGADDRAEGQQAVPRGRLAGRLDDHRRPCCRSSSTGSTRG